MLEELRPAGDIVSRSLRIALGGKTYTLAVLFMAGNERWRTYQAERTSAFVDEMAALGNDSGVIAAKFAEEPDMWLDLLYAYDTDCGRRAGVLPPREELKEGVFEDEPEAAIREVVKAANPKAAAAWVNLTRDQTTTGSPTPTSSPRPSTDGRQKRSAKH